MLPGNQLIQHAFRKILLKYTPKDRDKSTLINVI